MLVNLKQNLCSNFLGRGVVDPINNKRHDCERNLSPMTRENRERLGKLSQLGQNALEIILLLTVILHILILAN